MGKTTYVTIVAVSTALLLAPATAHAQPAAEITSQTPTTITINTSTPDGTSLPEGTPIIIEWENQKKKTSKAVAYTLPDGTIETPISLWKTTDITLTTPSIPEYIQQETINVTPQNKALTPPKKAPKPAKKYRINPDPAAEGKGPNPQIKNITKETRRNMTGLSWRPGCTPIANLREVHINYWGQDGYRYRGVLIVHESIAKRTVSIFSKLYKMEYRIRSMHPVDRYGPNPRGPGANDYASMAAGNTSGFNCRYVVGRESSRAWSPHASGRAIDLNPWENPYVSRTGVYPNSWWLYNRHPDYSLASNQKIIKLFRSHGLHWGGGYRDYHHFD